MTIGLGSYAFFWAHKNGLTLHDALRATHAHGVDLFQIIDYPALEGLTVDELRTVRALADELGVRLELGTRGLSTVHLRKYLDIARELGVTLVRSMVDTPAEEAKSLLDAIVPELGDVTLALETYERFPTARLVALVEAVADSRVGICLDPANTIAILETPESVIDLTKGHVVNIHVKDFAFSRQEGWVGFTLAGAPLGEGLLDFEHLMSAADPQTNRIIEHWVPWQGDLAITVALESEWTARNLDYLRSNP
jgi:3-oxoisoapionate decarboxylase